MSNRKQRRTQAQLIKEAAALEAPEAFDRFMRWSIPQVWSYICHYGAVIMDPFHRLHDPTPREWLHPVMAAYLTNPNLPPGFIQAHTPVFQQEFLAHFWTHLALNPSLPFWVIAQEPALTRLLHLHYSHEVLCSRDTYASLPESLLGHYVHRHGWREGLKVLWRIQDEWRVSKCPELPPPPALPYDSSGDLLLEEPLRSIPGDFPVRNEARHAAVWGREILAYQERFLPFPTSGPHAAGPFHGSMTDLLMAALWVVRSRDQIGAWESGSLVSPKLRLLSMHLVGTRLAKHDREIYEGIGRYMELVALFARHTNQPIPGHLLQVAYGGIVATP